ncbi:MAG: YbbR-like domain-containing protein [Anaerolineae bacterium]|nr:YbbR-like domain-containing protein [Anaerolineae bacterium]
MKLREALQNWFRVNLQWLLISLLLAVAIWVVAVSQTDPIEQRVYSRPLSIEFRVDDNMIIEGEPSNSLAQVRLRAPLSEWEVLRADQIRVIADLRGIEEGTHRITLRGELEDGLRADLVSIDPSSVRVSVAQFASQRIPLEVQVTQEPPVGFFYPDLPNCGLSEVTARGVEGRLADLKAVARINLSDERNPGNRRINLIAVDAQERNVPGITLDPSQVTCEFEIRPNEGVSEISVLPDVSGFPPGGYIYEGYEIEPPTVLVAGSPSAIRALNGVVETETISLAGADSSFERTVAVQLPDGVSLDPPGQTVNVRIRIGTVTGSRQYEDIPIQVEGAPNGLEVTVLPDVVDVLVVGPQPFLQALSRDALRVSVEVSGLEPGTYQLDPSWSIIVQNLMEQFNGQTTTITIQPNEVNATVSGTPSPP